MILGSKEITPYLMKAVLEWRPTADINPEEYARILKKKQAEEARLLSEQTSKTLPDLLECIVSSKQIDWALEQAYANYGTRQLEPRIAIEIHSRQHLLTDNHVGSTLEILVGVTILAIEIPDPSKDEISLRLWLTYSTSIDEFLRFMVAQGLMRGTDVEDTKRRWLQSDALIGNTPEEREILNSCLNAKIVREIDQKTKYTGFFISMRDSLFCKESLEIFTISYPLNLNRYPFDSHSIQIDIENDSNFDITQEVLLPDHTGTDPTVDFSEPTIPRGFRLIQYDKDLQPYGRSLTLDSLCYSLLQFNFILQRRPSTFIWRTLIPSLMITTLTLFATSFVTLQHQSVGTVMTLIPGVLIALAGMQYSAAQSMPPNSGRTIQDIFFIALYIALSLMFGSLLVAQSGYSAQAILLLAVLVLVISISIIAWLIAKPLST